MIETPTLTLSSAEKLQQVKDVIDPMMLSEVNLQRVMATLEEEMKNGLSSDREKRKSSSLQMENTYVYSLLDGSEEGDFLALDLGGTNFRVILCEMRQGKVQTMDLLYYSITPEVLSGPSRNLHDFLASCIFDFLKNRNLLHKRFPLGFTFSFPMEQEALNKGILVTWTKTFKCTDGVGDDAVKALEDAIHRRGDLNVDVVAVLNDTTGTLLCGSYVDHKCEIGLIMGTGCNAAYVEQTGRVEKWTNGPNKPKQVVVDIEWGAFGDNGSLDFLKTEFDAEVDKYSNHVGSFTFEKLFSGNYMGEQVRLALQKLTRNKLIFSGEGSEKLFTRFSVSTAQVTHIDNDTEDRAGTVAFLEELGLSAISTEEDIAILQYLCAAISIRAVQLVGGCLAVLLQHVDKSDVTIAMDGSQYEKHAKIRSNMDKLVKGLIPQKKINIILVKDGSGQGAAFVAAVAVKQQKYAAGS